MPPCGTDSMTSHRVVQIRPVTEAKNPGEKDVGINPERREILGIGIQKDEIRTMANHSPCQNVSIGHDTPGESESPQKAGRRGWRRNETGIGPEAVGPATEETMSDKAEDLSSKVLKSLGLTACILRDASRNRGGKHQDTRCAAHREILGFVNLMERKNINSAKDASDPPPRSGPREVRSPGRFLL